MATYNFNCPQCAQILAADSSMAELQPFLKGTPPVCRDGGLYTVGAITSNPTCSKGPSLKHALSTDSR